MRLGPGPPNAVGTQAVLDTLMKDIGQGYGNVSGLVPVLRVDHLQRLHPLPTWICIQYAAAVVVRPRTNDNMLPVTRSRTTGSEVSHHAIPSCEGPEIAVTDRKSGGRIQTDSGRSVSSSIDSDSGLLLGDRLPESVVAGYVPAFAFTTATSWPNQPRNDFRAIMNSGDLCEQVGSHYVA